MLSSPQRTMLIERMCDATQSVVNLRTFIKSVNQQAEQRINDPISLSTAAAVAVDMAEGGGWLLGLVRGLAQKYPGIPQFHGVLAEISSATQLVSAKNPAQEVLLAGDRPFVNRKNLRAHVVALIKAHGPTLLLVNGETDTGKSFSRYMIAHIASQHEFVTHHFDLKMLPSPGDLAGQILGRIGSSQAVPEQGNMTGARWAERLAILVHGEILRGETRRVLIFDEDGKSPNLPEDTCHLISLLTKSADGELRPYLRMVISRFSGVLTNDVDDAAERDDVTAFTTTDMLEMIMQVVAERGWGFSEQAVRQKLQELNVDACGSLNERTKRLQLILDQLKRIANQVAATGGAS